MQRLKGLMTVTVPSAPLITNYFPFIRSGRSKRSAYLLVQGGLPTFMDVGNSFSAAAVTEDNLIDQLRSHGKRLVRA